MISCATGFEELRRYGVPVVLVSNLSCNDSEQQSRFHGILSLFSNAKINDSKPDNSNVSDTSEIDNGS